MTEKEKKELSGVITPDTEASSFIKSVTNEWSLFAYRFITGGAALLMSWWLFDLKTTTFEIRRDFNNYQLVEEARLSKTETVVVEVRRRLDVIDNTLQAMWIRIIDLNTRSPQQFPNKPN